jgi:hypothetical protein
VKPDELQRRFDRHPNDAFKASMQQLIRNVVKDAAGILDHELPEGREKSLALTKLEEAMFWSLAAIERGNGLPS